MLLVVLLPSREHGHPAACHVFGRQPWRRTRPRPANGHAFTSAIRSKPPSPGSTASISRPLSLCCRIEPFFRSRRHRYAAPLARRPRQAQPRGGPPGARRATAAAHGDLAGSRVHADPVQCTAVLPRARLSQSRSPRQWRPNGPSHAIGYADH